MSKFNVSVVVVNYNCHTTLENCIRSILLSKSVGELLLIDNASTDNSLNLVKEIIDPRLKIIKLNQNIGLPAARNLAAVRSQNKYLAFTDADAVVDPEWLQEPCYLLESRLEIGAVQCKNLSLKNQNKISFAGAGIDDANYFNMSKDQLTSIRSILYPIGASIIVRKDVFNLIKGFDSNFFVGHDDIDFGIRLWLSGYQVVCSIRGIVYHDGGALRSRRNIAPIFQFYGSKNTLYMWTKNFHGKTIAKYGLLFALPYICKVSWLSSAVGAKAVISFFKELPTIMIKRNEVQQLRKIPDEKIIQMVRNSNLLPVQEFADDFKNLFRYILRNLKLERQKYDSPQEGPKT